MKHVPRILGWLVVVGSLVSSAPQDRGDTLTVTRKTTKLRQDKRLFAPAVTELKEGDRLVLEKKEGAWLSVVFAELKGWLHETDVSAKKEIVLSGEGVSETYTASETAAARKGFNPQVEQAYRKEKPALEAAFRLVDKLQAREVADEELREFLVAGGLLEEGQ